MDRMTFIDDLTPVERGSDYYFKRDDLFAIGEVCGGKARSAYQLIMNGTNNGKNVFVTAGSRHSPQVEIVSYICELLNLKCVVFIPRGANTSVIENITKNKNTTIMRTKVGYNNVICAWAKQYAEEHDYCYIPFGMECLENVEVTANQVKNIPVEVKRIVVPVGSGMSLISIINGLNNINRHDCTVVGVQVGKSPHKNIEKYLSSDNNIDYEIITSELRYDQEYTDNVVDGVELDKIYEAKCIPYLKKDDLLWVVGKRKE